MGTDYVRFADRPRRRLEPTKPMGYATRRRHYLAPDHNEVTGPERRRLTHKMNHAKRVAIKRNNARRRAKRAEAKED